MFLQRAFGLVAVAAAFLFTTSPASAQTAPVTADVSKHGTVVGTFTGEYEITGFKAKNGVLYAVGNLTGEIALDSGKTKKVDRRVALPVDMEASGIGEEAMASIGEEEVCDALDCNILHLVLGPLDLTCWVWKSTNQVVLDIEADPTGGLLGQLLSALCGLSLLDILDLIGNLGDLVDFLNLLLDLLG